MSPPREWPQRDTQKQGGEMTARAEPTSVNSLKTAHNVAQ